MLHGLCLRGCGAKGLAHLSSCPRGYGARYAGAPRLALAGYGTLANPCDPAATRIHPTRKGGRALSRRDTSFFFTPHASRRSQKTRASRAGLCAPQPSGCTSSVGHLPKGGHDRTREGSHLATGLDTRSPKCIVVVSLINTHSINNNIQTDLKAVYLPRRASDSTGFEKVRSLGTSSREFW